MKVEAIQLTHKPFLFEQFKNDEQNLRTTELWLRETPTAALELGFGTTLYRRMDSSDGEYHDWYFAVKGNRTVYAVRVGSVKAHPINALCQVGVWSSENFAVPKRFAPTVFWNFLFEKANIISDCIQTPFGRRFWLTRISEAHQKQLPVYWVRLKAGSIKECYRLWDDDKRDARLEKAWGDTIAMQEIRLLITKHPLQFTKESK